MRNEILEKELRQSLRQFPVAINKEQFARTLTLVQEEACLKQRRARISFTCFLWKQIKFIGFKIWMVQGIFLFFINRILSRLYERLVNPQNMAKLLFSLSVLVCMSVLPFLYRSVRYQMQEVEAATRFSCTKLLLARLIVIGIGDLTILSGIFLTTMVQTVLPADSTFLYLCFPFLLAGSGCLFMLEHFAPRQFLMGSFLFCTILALVFCVIPEQYGFCFQQSFSAVWSAICSLLLICCIRQVRRIILNSVYVEIQVA